MGKTSSAVKDRYNAKVYDTITLRVPKGQKEVIQAAADAAGQSLNAFIKEGIDRRLEGERGKKCPRSTATKDGSSI